MHLRVPRLWKHLGCLLLSVVQGIIYFDVWSASGLPRKGVGRHARNTPCWRTDAEECPQVSVCQCRAILQDRTQLLSFLSPPLCIQMHCAHHRMGRQVDSHLLCHFVNAVSDFVERHLPPAFADAASTFIYEEIIDQTVQASCGANTVSFYPSCVGNAESHMHTW